MVATVGQQSEQLLTTVAQDGLDAQDSFQCAGLLPTWQVFEVVGQQDGQLKAALRLNQLISRTAALVANAHTQNS